MAVHTSVIPWPFLFFLSVNEYALSPTPRLALSWVLAEHVISFNSDVSPMR